MQGEKCSKMVIGSLKRSQSGEKWATLGGLLGQARSKVCRNNSDNLTRIDIK